MVGAGNPRWAGTGPGAAPGGRWAGGARCPQSRAHSRAKIAACDVPASAELGAEHQPGQRPCGAMKAGEAGASPSRTPGGRGASAARGPATRSAGGGKRPGAGVSPGPRGSPGPGRTPQTKRRELSLTVASDKNSPTGSPRSRGEEGRGSIRRAGGEAPRRKKAEEKETEGSRKSSNSSQDSGVGREGGKVARREHPRRHLGNRGASPEVKEERGEKEARGERGEKEEREEREVGERRKFGELSDVTNIEMGIVKVPRELLEEVIHLEPIERYYTVEQVPVAR